MTEVFISHSKVDAKPSPSIPQSLPVTGRGSETLPSTLNSPSQGLGCTFPYLIQSCGYPNALLGLLTAVAGPLLSTLSSPSPSPHGTVQSGGVHSGLPQMFPPLTMLSHTPVINSSSAIPRSIHVLSFFNFFFSLSKKKIAAYIRKHCP